VAGALVVEHRVRRPRLVPLGPRVQQPRVVPLPQGGVVRVVLVVPVALQQVRRRGAEQRARLALRRVDAEAVVARPIVRRGTPSP
jgi:hypothetical protein